MSNKNLNKFLSKHGYAHKCKQYPNPHNLKQDCETWYFQKDDIVVRIMDMEDGDLEIVIDADDSESIKEGFTWLHDYIKKPLLVKNYGIILDIVRTIKVFMLKYEAYRKRIVKT